MEAHSKLGRAVDQKENLFVFDCLLCQLGDTLSSP